MLTLQPWLTQDKHKLYRYLHPRPPKAPTHEQPFSFGGVGGGSNDNSIYVTNVVNTNTTILIQEIVALNYGFF